MRVLYLGPASPLIEFLERGGDTVLQSAERVLHADADFIVSYGYRHILKEPLISAFDGRAVNLHIAYLPWNRGADPNLWSWIDGTPKGVSIHYIDAGIDTGDLIAQREISMDGGTLASTYAALQSAIVELFKDTWPAIRIGACGRQPHAGGSFHRVVDRERVAHLLTAGWNTNVHDLRIP